jgi:hypothetical protein
MKYLPAFCLSLAMFFSFHSKVLADVAPPYFPPGSNPQPGLENTQVRMDTENVVITVFNDTKAGSLGSARITADFTMRNTGEQDEKMAVRFPISASDGRGEYPEITDINIKVNGQAANTRRMDYPEPNSKEKMLPWAEFNVNFPAGKDTPIEVSYTLRGTGYYPYTAFYYILESGAGWKDTIGSAEIILRLPYPANAQNIVQDFQVGWAQTNRGVAFQGNEARWHFENFEPGADGPVQNMEFALVSPAAWNTVLTEKRNVTQDPGDGEAWGRLGRAYKQIFFMNKGYRTDPGGAELYQLGVDAYEKCLEIKPDDAQWHAGFADMLVNRSYWDAWGKGPDADTYRGLNEIRTALRLAPNDPKVKEIATNLSYMFPDGMKESGSGFDFPWLTQTPTAIPPTATIVPAFDPGTIIGTYRSEKVTLSNKKKANLAVSLNPDHSAMLEIAYETETPVTLSGFWMDNGDGTLIQTFTDPIRGDNRFVFKIDQNILKAVEYPSIYGDNGLLFTKVVETTTLPAMTDTAQPAASSKHEAVSTSTLVPSATKKISSTPLSTQPCSGFPVCGSAMIPLAGIVLALRRKARKTPIRI